MDLEGGRGRGMGLDGDDGVAETIASSMSGDFEETRSEWSCGVGINDGGGGYGGGSGGGIRGGRRF